jgi:hypothetical protein
MLSIHSLAANLGTDPEWLLNNLELSRVRWKKGAHAGELLVEVDVVNGDEWGSELDYDSRANSRSGHSASSSRVGMFDEYYGGAYY